MVQKRMVTFTLGGMVFEYDEEKNRKNVQKHGISFRNAARVFFDYDRIEQLNSDDEDRYDTIGDISVGNLSLGVNTTIGNIDQLVGTANDILFVVYTERVRTEENGIQTDITRLISARLATSFERGIYYGKYE